jgi:hypothetical protein
VALAAIDPQRQGPQHILFRQRRKDFPPPAWGREVVVVADAGSPANATRKLREALQWPDVFARPRTRPFRDGKDGRAVVHPLPKSPDRRRATYQPDGRRQAYGVFRRHAALPQLGDGPLGRAKKRRNEGPTRVKSIVTKLLDARASARLSQ